jgi:hypothetical protein
MSKKRGNRGCSKSSKSDGVVVLKVRDTEQLKRTLDLRGIVGEKPIINSIMPIIIKRLDEEERQEMLEMAKRWRSKGWSHAMIYDCMGEDYPGWDEEVGYDPYEEIYSKLGNSKKSKKLNKKLYKHSKGKKGKNNRRYYPEDEDDYWANRESMFTHGEWSDERDLDNEDEFDEPYKCIKFYSDIENELSVREFYSLKDFNDFCIENGYNVSPTDHNNLVNWQVVHCCLDPISLEYGDNDILTDNSYGALYWTVSEDLTKQDAMSHEPVYDGTEARTLTD